MLPGQWPFHNTALLQNPLVLHYPLPLPGIRAPPPPIARYPWQQQQQQHQHHLSGASSPISAGAATDQVNNAISWGRLPPPPRKSPPWWNWSPDGQKKQPSRPRPRPPWREKGPNLMEGDIAVDADEEGSENGTMASYILHVHHKYNRTERLRESLSFQNQFRLGIRFDVYPEKRWSNNTIAYQISSEYGKYIVQIVLVLRRASCDVPLQKLLL